MSVLRGTVFDMNRRSAGGYYPAFAWEIVGPEGWEGSRWQLKSSHREALLRFLDLATDGAAV